jgi:hypothetical protein
MAGAGRTWAARHNVEQAELAEVLVEGECASGGKALDYGPAEAVGKGPEYMFTAQGVTEM